VYVVQEEMMGHVWKDTDKENRSTPP